MVNRVSPTREKEKLPKPVNLHDVSEIRPHLLLSGYGCVTEAKLKQLGVTHAVDATNLRANKRPSGVNYLMVDVEDTNIANIRQHFQKASDFIDEAKAAGGRCLVYCAAGVSRSATLVIMHLVLSEGLSLREAYFDVNQTRPIISPNPGFWQQMIDVERERTDSATVTLIRGRMARPVPDVYLHRTAMANQRACAT